MRGKIKLWITISILIIIGVVLVISYKNRTVNDTRGGVINSKKEIVYEVKNNYKDLEIRIKTDFNKRKDIKIIILDPNGNEKVIDTKTNKEIIKSFKGDKGEWTIKFECTFNEPVNFEVNFILRNK